MKYGLATSILRPRCARVNGDDVLVEYQLADDRLGYLPAGRLQDEFVIKTLLFLTTQGTRESDEFRRRLNLRRRDIEHLDPDHPMTFLATDLGTDPQLVRLFTDCGCGHLLKWTNADTRHGLLAGVANGVREYLRLDPPGADASPNGSA